jgi:hypothetical protein
MDCIHSCSRYQKRRLLRSSGLWKSDPGRKFLAILDKYDIGVEKFIWCDIRFLYVMDL